MPDARRVYTTFEQPDLKSVFTFTVTAPERLDGHLQRRHPRARDGRPTAWPAGPSARPSACRRTSPRSWPGSTTRSTTSTTARTERSRWATTAASRWSPHLDVDELVEVTKQGFAFFEDAFGYPYPFGKYDQAYVPEYNMGAMENAGCVTLRDEYLPRSRQTHAFYEQRANTVLHEMAHMWFGDLVTMKWWDDLWLNESFAEWAAHHSSVKATKYTEAWTGFTNARKNWAYRQDQLPSTHPVVADNHDLEAVEVNFDGITYAKGASILKQLVAYVGEEEFLSGLRDYFDKHAFGNTEYGDLVTALEAVSGRDLASWSRAWLETSGVNTLTPAFEVDEAGAFTSFAVEQTHHADFPTLRPHRIGIGLYETEGGRLVRRHHVETDVDGASTDDPRAGRSAAAGSAAAQRRRPVLRQDPSRRPLAGHAGRLDRHPRRLPGPRPVLGCGVGHDPRRRAVGDGLRHPRPAGRGHRDRPHRGERPAALRPDRGGRLLRAREPRGPEGPLGRRRAWARAGRGGRAATTSSRWSAPSPPPPTATPRWTSSPAGTTAAPRSTGSRSTPTCAGCCSTPRSARGGPARTRSPPRRQRDGTISGRERAASARALIPTAEAKEAAWQTAVDRDNTPNETQRQIAVHFQESGDEALLAPYVERYLTAAETIWESKGVQRSRVVLQWMFPRTHATQAVLDRVEAWLADNPANPGAVRFVREGADDVRRALAAQRFDASVS